MEIIELHGHEQTLWPDHCVQGTSGASLHPAISWSPISAIIRKGTHPEVDSYSGFRNNWDEQGRRAPTGLAGYLRERNVTDVVICGVARDVCALWTAEDAADAGFRTVFLWDHTRPVSYENDGPVRQALTRQSVTIVGG